MAKLNSSISHLLKDEKTKHARITHLTLYELNNIRPLFPDALNQLERLSKSGDNSIVPSNNSNTSMNFSLT